MGVDLEVQSTRVYPFRPPPRTCSAICSATTVRRRARMPFSPIASGLPRALGIECGYDKQLRGMAGAKSVLVNNVGYRQTENIWSPAEPGHNVVLTIDLQHSAGGGARLAGRLRPGHPRGGRRHGRAVGDILAMASSPTLDPNYFMPGISREGVAAHQRSAGREKPRHTGELHAAAPSLRRWWGWRRWRPA